MKKCCCTLTIAVILFSSLLGVAASDENGIGDVTVRFLRQIADRYRLDGPGMVYEWTKYELQSFWVEITDDPWIDPLELNITDSTCTFSDKTGEIETIAYSLPEGIDGYGRPTGEVYLQIDTSILFENLIFHYEEVGENTIPIISATVIELDGRGEIVIAEFVAEDNFHALPAGFRSTACIARNDRYVPPMYVYPTKDAPEASDLLVGETFYAQIVQSRTAECTAEGAYAPDRFLLWVKPMRQTETGEYIEVNDDAAVPYIVCESDNLHRILEGVDGFYPYGDAILRLTTDEAGKIVDAVFCEDE